MQPNRLRTLTSLRFLAAIAIVAYHTLPSWQGLNFYQWPPIARNILNVACVGLPFFFALSGFILFHVYVEALPFSRQSRNQFWIKRLARLLPIFYLGLALCWPIGLAALKRAGEDRFCNPGSYLLVNMAFLSAWFPSTLVFNFPTWSISVEFFCYALFPLLLPVVARFDHRSSWRWLVFSFLVGMIIQAAFLFRYPGLLFWPWVPGSLPKGITNFLQLNPLVHFPEFIFGVFLAQLWKRKTVKSSGDKLLSGSLLAIVALVGSGIPFPWLMMTNSLFLPLIALVIWGAACPRGKYFKWLEHRLFIEFGEMAYVIYVIHFPLSYAFSAIKPPFGSGFLGYLLFLTTLLWVSWCLHRLFELPCRRWLVKKVFGRVAANE